MNNTIIHPTWLSVVFENRNQQYGAFQLRKEYERNLIGGLLVSHASLIGLFGLIWLAYAMAPKAVKEEITSTTYKIIDVVLIPNIKIEPPKEIAKPAQTVKTTSYLPPVVVPDDKATSEVPTEDLLKGTVISSVTHDGTQSTLENPIEVAVSTPAETPVISEFVYVAEVMPSFPSEYGSINSFMSKLIRYPSQAISNGITGKVYVEFVIDENGYLINPKIAKGLGYGCDEEVLRILAMVPRWNPGKMNGRGVKVKMTVPVNFRLSE